MNDTFTRLRSYYWSVFLECSIYCLRHAFTKRMNDKEVDHVIILWRYLLRDVMKKIKVRDRKATSFKYPMIQAGTTADIAHRLHQMSIDDSRKYSLPAIQHKESNASSAEVTLFPLPRIISGPSNASVQ